MNDRIEDYSHPAINDKLLPFKMRTETPMEKYRAETFWTKEPETIEWIRSFDPRDIFFDIGANIGVYSLFAASLYPGMQIWAFEPMPANHDALVHNALVNGFGGIYAFRRAVGAWDDNIILTVLDGRSGATGAQMKREAGDGYQTRMISIDTFPVRPTHVKIDIDGQELEVVRGMQRTLPHIKSCLIEVSKRSKGPIMDIMTAAGFKTDNRFNTMTPHSRERRAAEGIDAENIVFTR